VAALRAATFGFYVLGKPFVYTTSSGGFLWLR